MLELRLIKHALALGRHRHFARAAHSLGLTQPSLSRSIAALESDLGVRLFDRTKDGVRPTAFGELLLARGAALIDGEADFRQELRLLAGLEGGTLCVGAGPYPSEISIGIAAGRLLRDHPRLRLQLVCASPEAIAEGVLAGQFDAGVCYPHGLPDTSGLEVEPLPSHPLLLACRPGHPLAGRKNPALAEVLAYPLATGTLPGPSGAAAASGSGAGTLDPESGVFAPTVTVTALSIACRVARECDALFPATAGMVARELSEGHLVALDFRSTHLRTMYSLCTRTGRSPAPAVVAFCDVLREVEAEIAAAEERDAVPLPRSTARRRSGIAA